MSRIVAGLRELGVREGDTLMVHSSLKSLGYVPGGARTVVNALLEVLGDEGTLLMPALSFMFVSPEHPVFEPDDTPSCVGEIPEFFRTLQRSIRSVHPTHSVCGVGSRARKLLGNHIVDTSPVGEYSPFRLLPLIGGKVLMLGCGLRPNTSMHGIEELSVPPFLFEPEPVTYIIRHLDKDYPVYHLRHSFRGYEQRYDRLEQVMDRGLARGKILQADCFLIDAEPMWSAVDHILRKDPLFFVEKRG